MEWLKKMKSNSETILLAVVALLIVCGIGYSIGRTSEIDKTATEALGEKGKELERITAEIDAQSELIDELANYKKEREVKQEEIKRLTDELTELTSEITQKQAELDRLTGAIYTVKSEKVLTAGRYIVGTDISPGLYDVRLVSGSGNFFSRGTQYANEIFGTRSDYYISEYKNLNLETGDEVELRSNLKVKLILKQ